MTYGATGLTRKLPVSYPGLTLWIILAKLRSVPGPKTIGSAQLVATGHLLHAREPMMALAFAGSCGWWPHNHNWCRARPMYAHSLLAITAPITLWKEDSLCFVVRPCFQCKGAQLAKPSDKRCLAVWCGVAMDVALRSMAYAYGGQHGSARSFTHE